MADEIRATAAGVGLQVRKAVRGFFTDDKKQVFLDTLASCCNVTRAAEAAGVCTSTIHNHQRKDPSFAASMAEAMECGYAVLEALLLERAAIGADYVPGATVAPRPDTIDTALAIKVMQMRGRRHGFTADGRSPHMRRADEHELTKKIMGKLDVLARRRERSGAAKERARAAAKVRDGSGSR